MEGWCSVAEVHIEDAETNYYCYSCRVASRRRYVPVCASTTTVTNPVGWALFFRIGWALRGHPWEGRVPNTAAARSPQLPSWPPHLAGYFSPPGSPGRRARTRVILPARLAVRRARDEAVRCRSGRYADARPRGRAGCGRSDRSCASRFGGATAPCGPRSAGGRRALRCA